MKNLRILRAIILITLCLALCASALVACEKNGNTETEQETTSATTEAEKTEQVEKFDYYNTDLSDSFGTSESYVGLAGNVVKIDPLAANAFNHTLCAKYHTVLFIVAERA